LDLEIPKVRQEYLKLRHSNPRLLDHRSRVGKQRDVWDNTKENGEVLIRRNIPSRRVLGYFEYPDLKVSCELGWWLETCHNAGLKTTYSKAISQLVINDRLLKQIITSANKLERCCILRDGGSSPFSAKNIFDAFLDSLRRSAPGSESCLSDGERMWVQITSKTSKSGTEDESGRDKEKGESAQKSDDIATVMGALAGMHLNGVSYYDAIRR
jgi:hypothetical protein